MGILIPTYSLKANDGGHPGGRGGEGGGEEAEGGQDPRKPC